MNIKVNGREELWPLSTVCSENNSVYINLMKVGSQLVKTTLRYYNALTNNFVNNLLKYELKATLYIVKEK